MPDLRGRLAANAALADITWFRVGGPAQVLFTPADEADLAYFLKNNAAGVAHSSSSASARTCWYAMAACRVWSFVSGAASAKSRPSPATRLTAGTAVPDVKVARAAAEAGIAGLAFYRGIPGSIGGALRMNAGAHGRETKDVPRGARAVDREGNIHVLSLADMGFTYRHCSVPDDWIFTEATFRRYGRRAGRNSQRDGRSRRIPREEPADQGTHRRLDV